MLRLRCSSSLLVAMSAGLMLCVPVLALPAFYLSIKLRQTLLSYHDNALLSRLRSQEKTVFWLVFFACLCLRNVANISLFSRVVILAYCED